MRSAFRLILQLRRPLRPCSARCSSSAFFRIHRCTCAFMPSCAAAAMLLHACRSGAAAVPLRARATGARRRSSGLVPVAPEIRPLRQASLQANPGPRCRRRSDKASGKVEQRRSRGGVHASPPLALSAAARILLRLSCLPCVRYYPRSHLCQAHPRHRPNALSRTQAAAAGEPREHAHAQTRPAPTCTLSRRGRRHAPCETVPRSAHFPPKEGRRGSGAAAPTGALLLVSVLCLSITGGVRVQGRNPRPRL